MSKRKITTATTHQVHDQKISTPQPLSWFWYILTPLTLVLCTFLFYYPSLHYSFQFDDVANITKYFNIRNHSFSSLFFSGTRWISYWLNSIYYKIGRFDPFMYRLGNVTFHTITGILIFFFLFTVLSRLKKESFFKRNAFLLACTTALLFLLHPVQTQTVSYVIQGELEGLAMLFVMSIMVCFVARCFVQNTLLRIFFTSLLFVLGAFSCGTKEIAIISPALLIIVDWFFVAQGQWSSLKKRLLLHSAYSLLILALYTWFLKIKFFTDAFGFQLVAKNNVGNVITQHQTDLITPLVYGMSQFKVILHYLLIFLWPFNISVEYDWLVVRGFLAPDCIFPFIALVAIAYLLCKELWRDHASVVAFGLVWFFCCILPRSSIIPSSELLVDYKTYMGSLGWLFVIACALVFFVQQLLLLRAQRAHVSNYVQKLINHTPMQAVWYLVLLLPVGFLTVERNTVWRSGVEFWGNMIKNAPGKARAYNNYGVELSQTHHKYEEAIQYFKKAIAMDNKYPDPCNNIAVAYSALGNIDLAIEALKQSINISPMYPEAYNNLASFLLQKKEYEQVEKLLKIALELRPHYGKAHFNMGRKCLEQQQFEQAWGHFKNACTKGDMDNDLGFSTFANISMALKKYDDAIWGYTKTLEFNPNFPEAMQNLGDAYCMSQRYEQAVKAYEQALKTARVSPQLMFNLGESYNGLGRVEQAAMCYKKVEQFANMQPLIPLRIAECLVKMGQVPQAQQTLQQFLGATEKTAQSDTLVQVRSSAQQLLSEIAQGKFKVA